ncbi:MAG: MBL fold metallo-hydrolase [Candidatus Eremiobacteraeota bacterium]|nr:MBL fold metallo-hydrolase [Candidatus Eremiobacteraeota bacterium]MCW5871703.1 MBL fold metallo-hydrolase [Candidatus Eremiobacteraeota bacterium]
MRIHFIGGAHEVGGSCSVVEVGGRRVLIDCGQRMGGAAELDRLPDLQRVQELGGLDAILVTHAHADHIGALPLIHLAFPKVPLYTNEATLALMKIMLADSLKIMKLRWLQETEIPLYPEHAVTSMLARVEVVKPGDTFDLCESELQATFLLSGHVLGACSLTLDTAEGRVLFTGDYSVDAQRTVDAIVVPPARPHVVVTEATYGNRLHANRKAEEFRLAEAVAKVVGRGGKVLIPAFALGRAQEVLLILLREMKVGRIPQFPVFVDGMVRNVCQIYALFPEFLAELLKKRVEREGNPFFYEGSPARAVSQGERESVPLGEPCCIVSSSGMLNGGPSQFYAAELAGDRKNAIFITGYQDEESPGGKVLALAEGTERSLRLMERIVRFECQIAKYNLSAHADAVQIAALVERLGPRLCYLVHGDEGARAALAPMIQGATKTLLPYNGEVVEFAFESTLARATAVARRPRPVELPPARRGPRAEKGGHAILDRARKAVALIEEIRQVGWRPETRELLLYVAFPRAFEERRAFFLRELADRLEVSVVVIAKNTAGELAELARKHLPVGARLLKPPSLFPDGRVVLKVRLPEEVGKGLVETLQRETGLDVTLEKPKEAGEARELIKADGRMELNAAYRRVREALGAAGLAVLRCGKKDVPDEHIEVGLLAPWLLESREELVKQLESETGYPVRASGANLQALEKKARELLPPAWQVLKPFRWSGREARVALARSPEEAELQSVTRKLQDELGIYLRI